jgi:hypothetical protein
LSLQLRTLCLFVGLTLRSFNSEIVGPILARFSQTLEVLELSIGENTGESFSSC